MVLVMGFWPWMVMGNGFGWVKLGIGGGRFWLGLKSGWVGGVFCGGYCYWSEAGLRWWLAMASRGCGLWRGLRKMERQWERETEEE